VECDTPNTFYVGTTYRTKEKRFQEHFEGWGCRWTRKHGCKKIIFTTEVDRGEASQLENEKWMELARIYGPCRVRGGDVTYVDKNSDALPAWLLPQEFGGNRFVQWG